MAAGGVTVPSRPWARVLVALLVLLALCAREWGVFRSGEREVAPLVTDPDTAWHLRRASLALGSSRLAQSDRFLGFPDAVGSTDLPVFDELLALCARALTGGRIVEEGRPPDTERLESLLRGLGPVLAVAWLLLLYRLVRKEGGAGVGASLVALAFFAFSPVAVELGGPGRLHVEVLAAPLFVLQLGSLLAVWRSEDPIDRMLLSIVAGFLTGLGLATSPLFIAPLLAGWAAWVVACVEATGEERRDSARAALLFWICAMLVGQVSAIGGPWLPASTGPVAEWAKLLQYLFLAGAAPLLLGLVAPRRSLPPRVVRLAVAVVLVGLLAALFAAGASGRHGTVLLAALGRGVGAPPLGAGGWLGPELVPAAVFLLALVRGTLAAPGPARIFVGTAGLLSLGAALLHPPAVLFFAAPAVLALAHTIESAWSRHPMRVGVALALAWCVVAVLTPAADHAGERIARTGVWLRRARPPAGPWSSATAIQSDGILCDDRTAPLLAWYARRACASFGPRRAFEESEREVFERVLAAPDEDELARRASTLGLRYLVLAPGSAEAFARLGADPETIEALRVSDVSTERLRTIHTTPEPRVAVLEILAR